MKKAIALAVIMLVACAPIALAADAGGAPDAVCKWAASDSYPTAASGRLLRGIANAGFGWLELFRQPMINDNKWEGFSKGVVHTVGRTLFGVLEAATFFLPQVEIPAQDPACPLEMISS